MRIGELAVRAECRVETVRYYEHAGLLPAPARTGGNYRVYGDAHVDRLRFIRHCRALDMTLDEIRTLLELRDAPQASCEAVNRLLDAHIGHVAARIETLQTLAAQLAEIRRRCMGTHPTAECGILQELGAPGAPLPSEALTAHVAGSHGHQEPSAANGARGARSTATGRAPAARERLRSAAE